MRPERIKLCIDTLCGYPHFQPGQDGHQALEELKEVPNEIKCLQEWINDLQSGMYINCVYCGHRYGPKEDTPSSMADVLKDHIEQCPKHPMSKLKTELDKIKEAFEPVLHWYQSDEDHERPLSEMIADATEDLKNDRVDLIRLTTAMKKIRDWEFDITSDSVADARRLAKEALDIL